jgi:glycosyltransferase involved in cell wall biosynthesis
MQQTIKDLEIIIVDSGSTDATLSIAEGFPVKILHIQPEEFSFGRSLNTGCEAARGKYIVVISAHVYPVYTDWLENLIKPFIDPQVAMVYGKQRGNHKTKYSEHQIFANWFPDKPNPEQDHPFCNNANAAIRASLWRQNSYDETLTGLEDINWAKWALETGYKLVYQDDAVIIHVHDEKALETYNRYRREALAFKRIFQDEKFYFKDLVILFLSNVFSDFKCALHESVFVQRWLEIICFRLMQFWGTYRGFNQSDHITRRLRKKFYYSNHVFRRPQTSTMHRSDRQQVNYNPGGHFFNEDN